MFTVLAGFGIWTSIGLFRLRSWARAIDPDFADEAPERSRAAHMRRNRAVRGDTCWARNWFSYSVAAVGAALGAPARN